MPLRRSGADDHAAGEDRDVANNVAPALSHARWRSPTGCCPGRTGRGDQAEARDGENDVEVGAVGRDRPHAIARRLANNENAECETREHGRVDVVLATSRSPSCRYVDTWPLSTDCLSCCRSSRISVAASRPIRRATASRRSCRPAGCTCSRTRSRVRRRRLLEVHRPGADTTSEPSSERQPITLFGHFVDDFGVPFDVACRRAPPPASARACR